MTFEEFSKRMMKDRRDTLSKIKEEIEEYTDDYQDMHEDEWMELFYGFD